MSLYLYALMGKIRVHNIRIHTNHGCMEEEKKIGSDYIVNVEVEADLTLSSKSDELKDTVDYVAIHQIVYQQMKQRSKLLEHVVKRILDQIMKDHPEVNSAQVEVAKVNPPIGGDVGYVSVERKVTRG